MGTDAMGIAKKMGGTQAAHGQKVITQPEEMDSGHCVG